jgi:uncharacterized damage-inducible protein DinB
MEPWIEQCVDTWRINNRVNPHPVGFLGYMISHEAYHRGEICVALTESGRKLDDAILYDQWDWSKR